MSAEIECFDNIILAQFIVNACVKLRDPTSVGIETGQYRYLQLLFFAFSVLSLDILIIKTGEDILCDVE